MTALNAVDVDAIEANIALRLRVCDVRTVPLRR